MRIGLPDGRYRVQSRRRLTTFTTRNIVRTDVRCSDSDIYELYKPTAAASRCGQLRYYQSLCHNRRIPSLKFAFRWAYYLGVISLILFITHRGVELQGSRRKNVKLRRKAPTGFAGLLPAGVAGALRSV